MHFLTSMGCEESLLTDSELHHCLYRYFSLLVVLFSSSEICQHVPNCVVLEWRSNIPVRGRE